MSYAQGFCILYERARSELICNENSRTIFVSIECLAVLCMYIVMQDNDLITNKAVERLFPKESY